VYTTDETLYVQRTHRNKHTLNTFTLNKPLLEATPMKTCKTLFMLLVLCFTAIPSIAQTTPTVDPINIDQLLEKYFDSWSTVNPEERLRKLNAIWIEKGVHQSPYGRSEGIANINQEIANFLKTFPGANVKFERIKRTGNYIVCDFMIVDAAGKTVLTGVDYFEITDKGQIVKVIGFFSP
jgi:hypothetical protein